MLSNEELNSLIFYQGDVYNYIVKNESEKNKYTSNFYKTKHAYHILNMLLYPGMDNEIIRICNEKKNIPIDLLNSMSEILIVYNNIFSSMCKYSLSKKESKSTHAFRKDRMQSLAVLNQGYTTSFSSCSLEDLYEEYFLKKDGILLLEFEIYNTIPQIVLNDVIPNSSFEYQNEILLAPFATFEKVPLELTEKEKLYKDINKLPPKAKFLVNVNGTLFEEKRDNFYPDITVNIKDVEEGGKRAANILKKLKIENKLTESEKSFYIKWKSELQSLVYKMFKNIYHGICVK